MYHRTSSMFCLHERGGTSLLCPHACAGLFCPVCVCVVVRVCVCVCVGPLITELETCWHRPSMCLSDSGGNVRYPGQSHVWFWRRNCRKNFFWGWGVWGVAQLTANPGLHQEWQFCSRCVVKAAAKVMSAEAGRAASGASDSLRAAFPLASASGPSKLTITSQLNHT